MDLGGEEGGGMMASLRRIARSLLGLVETRVELFAIEFQEEKLRAMRLLLWLATAIAFASAGLLVAIGGLAIVLWQAAGFLGLVGLAAAALAVAAGIVWRIHRQITYGPPPFSETVSQLRKDAQCLQSTD